MDKIYIHESQVQSSPSQPPSSSPVPNGGFPILAIAILGIMATIFLLVSYYIFITKCCFFSWQTLDPLRRFSFRRTTHQNDDPLMAAYSPSIQCRGKRGLDELLIREIPTFQYTKNAEHSLFKCVVCLNEFQEHDFLRLLPKCNHTFHLDCIDIWLQSNSNCPLCRTSISGMTRYPVDTVIAPNSSPQESQPFVMTSLMAGNDEDFVVIELTGDEGNQRLLQQDRSDSYRQTAAGAAQVRNHPRKMEQKIRKMKQRKFHHFSIMGDECINVREKDDQFSIQPIRRSFSMDSAVDRQVYLSVQEIIRHNRNLNESRNNDGSSTSRSQRSIFSFGHSKRSVLPVLHL